MSFLKEAKKESEKTKQALQDRIERERQENFAKISEQCLSIANNLKNDILTEARGEDAEHLGRSDGYLKYRIRNKDNDPEVFFNYEKKEIEATEGFQKLKALCAELGVKISIEESESDIEDDPDIPAPSLYFFGIEVSGW